MMTEQEIYERKNPVCVLCNRRFPLAGLNSRFGGGRVIGGVPMCSRCENDHGKEVIRKYQSVKNGKMHLTEGEREAIIRSRTKRQGPFFDPKNPHKFEPNHPSNK